MASTLALETPEPMAIVRWLDLVVLALALPVFALAGFPLAGYAAGGGAWVVQRAVQTATERRAKASEDPRTVVGLTAGSMIARGWLVALTIFLVGITVDRDAGLAAAVLTIVLFTTYFTSSMILRPFEGMGERGRGS